MTNKTIKKTNSHYIKYNKTTIIIISNGAEKLKSDKHKIK
ncbi:hypothetical protein CLV93_102541 [Prolixibacter denitrificans]|uniref:Uncharacterized protein n=1 Tax=Prolixibacter denitrificans TaxID=1541063 RepID=A0A2P8CIE3_9BACT|nr:hypothetical protein CLV93_102541 [Prolixibacter denitrificans]